MILANSCSQLPSFAPHVTQGPGKPQTLRALALLLPFVWQEHPRACSSRLESLPIQRKLVSVGCRCGGGGGSRGFAARGWVGRDPQGFWKQMESITAGAVPALGVIDAPQAPSLVSILPFLLTEAASRGEGEPQQEGRATFHSHSQVAACWNHSHCLCPWSRCSGMGSAAVSLLGEF